jgi:endogenous inhibitor of DNA gyrase (YacG/DUF329 family)
MIKTCCPICDRSMRGASPKEWPEFPFCSPKCKLIDLGRWLGESYRVPTKEEKEEEEEIDAPTEEDEELE